MKVIIIITFALSLWITLTALGLSSSFDGLMLALLIVFLAAVVRLAVHYIRSVGYGSRD